MLRKYAELQIIDARMGESGRFARTAHRAEFSYEPRDGFLYVRSRAISSRTNDNFDHFPAEEIKTAWRTFIGKPVFVNHHNADHRRARGVIIDAALHEDRLPDGQPDTWVEVLMEVDAHRFPKLAKAILAGEIERTSMGTDVAFSICSACGNKATNPAEYCRHIPSMKGQKIRRKTASGDGTEDVLVYESCYGLGFFENSLLVEEPADPTAAFIDVDDRGVGGGYHGTLAKAASKTALDYEDDEDEDELEDAYDLDHGIVACGRCGAVLTNAALSHAGGRCPGCRAPFVRDGNGVWMPRRTSKMRRIAAEIIPVSRIRIGDTVENIAGYGSKWKVNDVRPEAGGIVRLFFSEKPDGMGFRGTDTLLVTDPAGRGLTDAEWNVISPPREVDPNNGPGYCPVCSRDLAIRGGRLPRHNFTKNTSSPCPASGVTMPEAEAIREADRRAERDRQRNYSLHTTASRRTAAEWYTTYQQVQTYQGLSERLPVHTTQVDDDVEVQILEGPAVAFGKCFWEVYVGDTMVTEGESDSLAAAKSDSLAAASRARESAGQQSMFASKLAYGETPAPPKVDTLRDESCPICGDTDKYDGDKCQMCGYLKPPDQFMDPDLTKAQEVDLRQQQEDHTFGDDGVTDIPDEPEDEERRELDSEQFTLTKPGDDPAARTDAEVEAAESPLAEEDALADPDEDDLVPDEAPSQIEPDDAPPEASPAIAEDDEDEAKSADGEEGSNPPQFDLKKDPRKKKAPKDPDDPEERKKKSTRSRTARVEHGEGTDVTMRPSLRIIAEQQAIIEGQGRALDRLATHVGLDVSDIKTETGRRVAALRRQADTENPAQPVPEPAPEAPSKDDVAETGEGSNDVEAVGPTTETDVEPDATDDVQSVGASTSGEELDLEEQDVTAPVEGTTEPNPTDEVRAEADVEAIDEVRSETANPIEDPSKSQTVGARTYAALRLARLRIEAGISEDADDILVAQRIEASKISDESIANEIKSLSAVVARKGNGDVARRDLVPRAAARTTPSLAPMTGSVEARETASVFSPSPDELLFD